MNILAVFAHPDDESYGPAGYLARLASQGHSIFLLTLTRGESGSLGNCKELPKEEVARLRSAEVNAAAKILGIQKNIVLTFPDKNLSNIQENDVLNILREKIRFIKPCEIITFHPNGISGHPDHKIITRWVTSVCYELKFTGRLLLYGLSIRQTAAVSRRTLHAIPENEINLTVDISEYLPQKVAAIKCHNSQLDIWKEFNSLKIPYREFAEFEYFSIYKS